MEYRIERIEGPTADEVLPALLADADASAISDYDAVRRSWRINTVLASEELIALLAAAGCRVSPEQVILVPSVCCGGCGG